MMREYELGLYEKAMPSDISWTEKLSSAKNAGYDYVEMSIDASEEKIQRTEMDKEERFSIVRAMYEIDIPIGSMCVSALTKYSIGNEDEKICARGLDILEKSICLAADLGIRTVMIPGYDVYYGESNEITKKKFIQNLKKAALWGSAKGVTLGLETMENEFMNTVEKALEYVNLCDSNYLKVYPDIGNMTNAAYLYKTNALEDLRMGQSNITSLHLKETKPGVFREVPYGLGHVDFCGAIQTGWEIGIRRYVTEFWYNDKTDWKMELNKAVEMMRGILDRQ